jgi:hypothetical protein
MPERQTHEWGAGGLRPNHGRDLAPQQATAGKAANTIGVGRTRDPHFSGRQATNHAATGTPANAKMSAFSRS